MVASGAVLLSTPGVTLPSRVLRQSLGAMFRPAAAALSAAAGALVGPAGTMGELTLLTDLLCRVNPGVFVINGTHNAKQGQYIVPNDELVDLAVPAKDGAQFRKAYIAVRVADSTEAGVAPGALTDIPGVIEVQPGALAAANPALPAATPNTLYLGELLIPSTASGQPVTITKYDPRTVMRGGVMPVLSDGVNRSGHDGAAPAYDGEYRDHPTRGLERGYGGAWGSAVGYDAPVCRVRRAAAAAIATNSFSYIPWDTEDTDTHDMFTIATSTIMTIKRSGYYRIGVGISLAAATACRLAVQAEKNNVVCNVGRLSSHVNADGGTEAWGTVPFNVNDTLRLGVYHDAGSNMSVSNPSFGPSFMEAMWVRPL